MLTEYSPYQDLLDAVHQVERYGFQVMNNPKILRAFRKGAKDYFHEVNTPDGLPALYAFRTSDNGMFRRSFLKVQGKDGISYVKHMYINDEGGYLRIIHGHAVKRYVERRQFKGTYEQALHKIINELVVAYSTPDGTSQTDYIDFDGGTFLCTFDGRIMHIGTFIMHRQCTPIQRLRSLESQKETTAAKRNFGFTDIQKERTTL